MSFAAYRVHLSVYLLYSCVTVFAFLFPLLSQGEAISCKSVFTDLRKRDVGIVAVESGGSHKVYGLPNENSFLMYPVRFEQRFDLFFKAIDLRNPRIHSNMQKILNRFSDHQFWIEYVTRLQMETREHMLASQNAKIKKLAEEGGLSRNAMLSVLVNRFKGRDPEIQFSTLTSNQDIEKFRSAIAKGPFFDKVFTAEKGKGISLHGADSHLIQRDAIADILQSLSSTRDIQKETFQYLSENPNLWNFMFDTKAANFTSPEFTLSALRKYLPIQ